MQFRGVICGVLLTVNAFGREPVHARSAMVVTQEPLATDVGVAVLKAGGNAVDAAVAIGFALPYAGNLGGGESPAKTCSTGRFLD